MIVGSGAGGAASAWKLAQAGLKVCVIEQGPRLSAADSPANAPFGLLERYRNLSPLASVRRSQDDLQVDASSAEVEVSFFQAVGGSTHLYSGHFPRFRERDFSLYTNFGLGVDWPLQYSKLKRYYEFNEAKMLVAGRPGDPKYPEITNLQGISPIGAFEQRLSDSFDELGWHLWPSYTAVDRRQYSSSKCTDLGPCNLGCPVGAKSTAANRYLEEFELLGGKVFSQTAAIKVVHKNSQASGVTVRDSLGGERTISAALVIIAAGAVGTPGLLINSGLSEDLPHLGRNLMLHPLALAEGVFLEEFDALVGPEGSWLYSLEFEFDEAQKEPGFMMQLLRGGDLLDHARRAFQMRKVEFGTEFGPSISEEFKKRLSIALVFEDLPEFHNRVTLDSSKSNSFGFPGVKIEYKVDPGIKRRMPQALDKARKVLSIAGAVRTRGFGPVRGTGWHPSGTARMGLTEKDSVCTGGGRLHTMSNVYVADSSLFPTGSCVNPANTIQSLSLLIADLIISGR
ncbi:GMC family oxidoreductase [Aquiluna sp.]|nr:GMC family oxidoreductase [Aquiluna sp.]